jgi:hypothetical protein
MRRFALPLALLVLTGTVIAQTADTTLPSISADKVVNDGMGTTTFTGHVVFTTNGLTIRADEAISKPAIHDVELRGNVHLTRTAPSGE